MITKEQELENWQRIALTACRLLSKAVNDGHVKDPLFAGIMGGITLRHISFQPDQMPSLTIEDIAEWEQTWPIAR